jgi:hypothetical protein
MLKQICDVCGKEVTWKVNVSYAAIYSRYTFCEECGDFIVNFLHEQRLIVAENPLIKI